MAFNVGERAKDIMMILLYILVGIAIPIVAEGQVNTHSFPLVMGMSCLLIIWIIIVIIVVFN